jgi:hypothetical protein
MGAFPDDFTADVERQGKEHNRNDGLTEDQAVDYVIDVDECA